MARVAVEPQPAVIECADLLQSVQLIYARTYQTIPLLIVACLWYLIITLALSYPQSKLESYFSRSTHTAMSPRAAVAISMGRTPA